MPQPRSAAAACLLDCGIALDEQRAKIPLSEGNYADIKGIAALIAAHCDSIKIIEIDILTAWLISVLEQGGVLQLLWAHQAAQTPLHQGLRNILSNSPRAMLLPPHWQMLQTAKGGNLAESSPNTICHASSSPPTHFHFLYLGEGWGRSGTGRFLEEVPSPTPLPELWWKQITSASPLPPQIVLGDRRAAYVWSTPSHRREGDSSCAQLEPHTPPELGAQIREVSVFL